jgi:hypothetical protein
MAFHQLSSSNAGIDWELLPSLQGALPPTTRHRPGPVWADTVMADFDASSPSSQFEEVMPGLSMREVTEPDIFRIFFGCLGNARGLS